MVRSAASWPRGAGWPRGDHGDASLFRRRGAIAAATAPRRWARRSRRTARAPGSRAAGNPRVRVRGRPALGLEAGQGAALGAARHADRDGEVENQRQVGAMSPEQRRLQPVDQVQAQPARDALVDAGRIRRSGRSAPTATCERRQDRAVQVVLARGQEQVDLGQRSPAFDRSLDDQLADRLGTLRAAWLAGEQTVDAARLQGRAKCRAGCSCPPPRPPSMVMNRPRVMPCRSTGRSTPDQVAQAARGPGQHPARATSLPVDQGHGHGRHPGSGDFGMPYLLTGAIGAGNGLG